ncbi:hypothetical protein DB44_GT00010 [Candidatus Protochlamydia amoebophila]|uniref:Uncharacterized protein n=1 Tax=Candidatus Protochlamydia amoebophila TaxID=362787 RepID=A0A0C1JTW8_9BACT|nr:hypothetical protein DB44_GT00010 [Candidatus Protochlamydia amoebophila]
MYFVEMRNRTEWRETLTNGLPHFPWTGRGGGAGLGCERGKGRM